MHILLSNDDGYQAYGLVALHDALSELAEITVVAPDRNRSGASNSLTLEQPIRAATQPNGFVAVDGTPTDCVHLAITGLLEKDPDMVIAGINAGANMGDDVIYSGTVAAATEGRFLGLPAIAVSVDSFMPTHIESAARITRQIVQQLHRITSDSSVILNINIPDCDYQDIKGIVATRLGHRHRAEPVIKTSDPRGKPIYWVGPPGGEQDAGPGTDFYAVRNGYVSVTPIQVDLTRHNAINDINHWLDCVTL